MLVAAVIGVALAGPPVAVLNIWLSGLSERQARDELDQSARRSMALAEARIGRAVETLDELAVRGIDSCQPSHIDTLRQATFGATPVKELSIVDPNGRTLCNDVGNRTKFVRMHEGADPFYKTPNLIPAQPPPLAPARQADTLSR